MKLEDLYNRKYLIEHTDARPLFVDMPAYAFSTPFNKDIPAYEYLCSYILKNQLDWTTLQSDIEKVGKIIIALDLQDTSYFPKLYRTWKKNFEKMLKYYRKEYEKDFSSLSDEELITEMGEYVNFYKNEIKFPAFLDANMFFADKKLHGLLIEYKQKNSIKENENVLFGILTAPIDSSFLSDAENDLVEIAQAKVNGKDISQAIKNHQQEFSYINSSYGDYKEYSLDLIKEKVEELINSKNLHKKLPWEENKRRKEKVLSTYPFTEEIIRLIKLTELFVKWQDERKVYTLTHIVLDYKYATEIARRRKVGVELLKYAVYDELEKGFKDGFDIKELEERAQEPFLTVYQKGKIVLKVIGKPASDFIEQCKGKVDKDIKEIKGLVASLGRARGTVRVVKCFEDSEKLKNGEILVISMTRPEHTPAMKKAAAVITDDGGITCHAAIVARELNKPCIIGTKIATKVLKDGDLIEVDAEKGIVKILKNR